MAKQKRISTKMRKSAMMQAMKSTLGNITASCDAVGITKMTHYNWLKSDAIYKRDIEELEDTSLDFAEAALLKNIKAGKEASIMFYLKTRGQKRGYIETARNINLNQNKEVDEFEGLSDEELNKYIEDNS